MARRVLKTGKATLMWASLALIQWWVWPPSLAICTWPNRELLSQLASVKEAPTPETDESLWQHDSWWDRSDGVQGGCIRRLSSQFYERHCWRVRVRTSTQPPKLRDSRNGRQSRPDHGGIASFSGSPRWAQVKAVSHSTPWIWLQQRPTHCDISNPSRWKWNRGEMTLMDEEINKSTKPTVLLALVDMSHRFALLSQLESLKGRYNWHSKGLQMCLVIREDQRQTTDCENIIYSAFCNTPSSVVLSDSKSLDVLRTMLTFARTFEIK